VWVVCGLIVLAAWWMYPVMRMHYVEQRNLDSLTAEYASIRAKNAALAGQVQRLKTRAGIEEAARESLGLVAKGESAYVVIDEGKGGKPATTTASGASSTRGAPTAADPVTTLLDAVFGFVPR
jgi:hypothetical protein